MILIEMSQQITVSHCSVISHVDRRIRGADKSARNRGQEMQNGVVENNAQDYPPLWCATTDYSYGWDRVDNQLTQVTH